MPMATIKTVDNDGNIIDMRRMFMHVSDAEDTDFRKREELKSLDEERENLLQIENDMLDLAFKRAASIKNLEKKMNSSLDGLLGNWKAIEIIELAWEKFGRSSEIVKEAVSRVRKCLFDDDLPQFRRIVFVGLENDYNYSVATNYLRMTFCRDDFDPSTRFTIWIPTAGKIIYNWKYGITGKGYLVTKAEKDHYGPYRHEETVVASLRLVNVAKAIKKMIVDGEVDFKSNSDGIQTDEQLRNDIVTMVMTGSLSKSQYDKDFGL